MKNYPQHYQELLTLMERMGKAAPDTMSAFTSLHQSTIRSDKLTSHIKELIALGIAICVRCDGCIAFHVSGALQAGASKEEVIETIGVAIMMGGGPAVVYGCEALEALEQFSQS